jgi:hypothetical protein
MILPKQQANAIASGRKTTHHTTNDALRVGARFNISYREGKQLVKTCYAQIVAREERELRDLTRDEAKREGYDGARGPLNFKRAWLQATQPAKLARLEQTDDGATDEAVARLYAAHAGRIVYVLTLALAEEPDQWMARSSGRLSKHQATSNPRQAIDELPLAPQQFVDAEAQRIRDNATATRAHNRKEAALERMAKALTTTNGKRANNAVRAMERIATSLERDTN